MDNLILDKSKAFAIRIINLYKHLNEEKGSIFCQSNCCEAGQA